ncbi:hypothetical protein GCO76_05220 [Rickettsia sp. R2]
MKLEKSKESVSRGAERTNT